ncbi:dTDP-4-dehydrorhamnose reductase [Ornithobacterium rhinotracheale]|uniref:dTDP-4-dehydrorhamnose reductase n=1 Tax=Ornithobacterium rhinotracheale TaxID=28251 RepID=A0A3R5X0E0_ORNRH|nr:dTDP-4-dehydrorhamnose reductase [Ornithobacterium rhinotracheale]QAR31414.1 dTDP-4-dehydrorhamnose reductase [Ornithobacterium rhinotracheale]
MKQVLVTGGNGQLGSCIRKIASNYPDFKFTFTDVATLDITSPEAVKDFFAQNTFDFVINCAAYTAVDLAETEQEIARKVNADAVGYLAEASRLQDAWFIHISTDYVFDGGFSTPILPEEKTNPLNIYGKTKLAGEELAFANNPKTIVIRTAWVYSEFGKNFVKTMLRLFREKDELSVVNDQIGAPTNANDLAFAILSILEKNRLKSGIYHFTNEGEISWFDFASAIRELSQSSITIHPVDSTAFPTVAVRPKYSVLDLSSFKETFEQEIPDWKVSLEKLLQENDL